GSTYRLLHDDSTLVRLSRKSGEPGSFTVLRKSGEVQDYGSTTESRHLHVGGQAIEWKVAELRDRSGNAIAFGYEHDADESDVRLASIDYGGNGPGGVAHERRVALRYEALATPIRTYLAGHALDRVKKLTQIDFLSGTQPISSYRLEYVPLSSGAGELLS